LQQKEKKFPAGMGCASTNGEKGEEFSHGEAGMKMAGKTGFVFLAGSLLGLILGQAMLGHSEDRGSKSRLPEGVYLDLNRDFYEALKQEGSAGTRTYSNDPSVNYLREISVSTRFMVETNLQILKNQERLIQLLEPRKK
jgi:hypothetical protein